MVTQIKCGIKAKRHGLSVLCNELTTRSAVGARIPRPLSDRNADRWGSTRKNDKYSKSAKRPKPLDYVLHTVLWYSTGGLTSALYASVLRDWDDTLTSRLRTGNVELALLVMCDAWTCHLRLPDMVTPRI